MDHPPPPTATASSASGQTDFNGDSRIIAPMLAKNHKPLTISTSENLYIDPGFRRHSFLGNPVIIGTIHLPNFPQCRGPLCVTGDTDNEYNVLLSIQSKNESGLPVSDEKELLQQAMRKAQELSQTDIKELLEVAPEMWKKMYTPFPDIEDILGREGIAERVGNDPSWVRDNESALFGGMIRNYVTRTQQLARHAEMMVFTVMINIDRLAEVYKRCGWMDLAEMDRLELAGLLEECMSRLRREGVRW